MNFNYQYGMIVEDDVITPSKYKIKTYVLEWSRRHGGIYVVTSKKKKVSDLEGKAGYQNTSLKPRTPFCFGEPISEKVFLRISIAY